MPGLVALRAIDEPKIAFGTFGPGADCEMLGIMPYMNMARAANIAALDQRGDGLAGCALPRGFSADRQLGCTGSGSLWDRT